MDLESEISIDVETKAAALWVSIAEIVSDLLWDAPLERRVSSEESAPLLARRLKRLTLPKQVALRDYLLSKSVLNGRAFMRNRQHLSFNSLRNVLRLA